MDEFWEVLLAFDGTVDDGAFEELDGEFLCKFLLILELEFLVLVLLGCQ